MVFAAWPGRVVWDKDVLESKLDNLIEDVHLKFEVAAEPHHNAMCGIPRHIAAQRRKSRLL
jgi:hypothetical protein